MKAWFQVALLAVGLCSAAALAEPDTFGQGTGRDGPLSVTTAGTVINRYTQMTGPAAPGDNVLLVSGTEGFAAGDLVMVLQVTGLVPEPKPGLSGPIDLTHDAVGRWELARLAAAAEGLLTLTAPLMHSYAAQVTQVIRVPEYTSVHIRRGASLRAVPWDGSSGGVVAFLATGSVHNDGEISATGAGFRGGLYASDSFDPMLCAGMAVAARPAAQKGEGVAVTQYGPEDTGPEVVSNGGGGGVCPMAGGGGGGNGGPGERGGWSMSMEDGSPDIGGQGGAKLVYSMLDHLTFGGGGGSGHGEDWSGPVGGAGGGAIFIRAHRLSGRGFIVADGEAGGSATMGGGSGGGAGGSIYLHLSGVAVCGGIQARGGAGGDAGAGILSHGGEGGGGGGGRALVQADSVVDCPASLMAGSNGTQAFSPAEMSSRLNDAQVEALSDGVVILSTSGVRITEPADGSTVSNEGGPPIKGCFTDSDGGCTDVGSYSFSVYVDGAKRCSVGGGVKFDCSPSPSLSAGPHVVYATATGSSGQGPAYRSGDINFIVLVDEQPPDTFINEPKPASPTNETSVSFTFSAGDEKNVKFECALDKPDPQQDDEFADCSSPGSGKKEYTDLSDGTYTFFVRAIDTVGNVDASPAEHTWTVDTVAPDTSISPTPSLLTNANATFQFLSNEGGVLFQCALDRPEPQQDEGFADCSSPGSGKKQYTNLSDGAHAFFVRAIDAAGNVDASPAKHAWTVDAVAPETQLSPGEGTASPTNKTSATFSFSSPDDQGAVFECALDDSADTAFDPCPSPMTYSGLGDGHHTFYVRAVDSVENKGSPVEYKWEVDTVPPVVTVLVPGDGRQVNSRVPTFSGEVKQESLISVDVLIDGNPAVRVFANEAGSWSLSSPYILVDGAHVVSAQATDKAGNVGELSDPIAFTVDTEPPDTTIVEGPPSPHNSELAAFRFKSPDSAAKFECQLDGSDEVPDFAACPVNHLVPGLSDGHHILRVRARDGAGNADPTPAVHEWDVIVHPLEPPEILEPADEAVVETRTPSITGKVVTGGKPLVNGTVTVYIDNQKSGVAQTNEMGNWSFRPPAPLEEGVHTLAADVRVGAGSPSEDRSPERSFTIISPRGESRAIGGGLSCAASGAQPLLPLVGLGLVLLARRRRRA